MNRISTIHKFYDDLLDRFGPQNWWPADTPWEVAVGAVLTQNTNWTNVEQAINNLKSSGILDVQRILDVDRQELAARIRPAGYFNIKATRLHNLATWWSQHSRRAADPTTNLSAIRGELLSVNGVGEETADSILLYGLDRLTFVVDNYTRRFLSRHGLADKTMSYREIQALFESSVPPDIHIYKEYHALIIALGKENCRTKPACTACPLSWHLPKPLP